MAHWDYSCCAVCDRTMQYGVEGRKEEMCRTCLVMLQSKGLSIVTPQQFANHVVSLPKDKALLFLKEIGYSSCLYSNHVDDLIKGYLEEASPAHLTKEGI